MRVIYYPVKQHAKTYSTYEAVEIEHNSEVNTERIL